jgi:hypothetical protein
MAPRSRASKTTFYPLFTMSNATPARSTVAGNPPAFVALTLGHSANAIDLLVLTAPPVTNPTDMKARCFDNLSDSLLEYAPVYSSAKLIAAFNHIFSVLTMLCLKLVQLPPALNPPSLLPVTSQASAFVTPTVNSFLK